MFCAITVAVMIGFNPATETDGAVYSATAEPCPVRQMPFLEQPGSLGIYHPPINENGPTESDCRRDMNLKGCQNG